MAAALPDAARPDADMVRDWLRAVPDPEIPVLSVIDLGVVRDIAWRGGALVIGVTPTFSACPATAVIQIEIENELRRRGVSEVRVERRLAPPWTTDWISEEGRAKLAAYGVAPPPAVGCAGALAAAPPACPQCASARTEEVSRFGSTPCKAAWRCLDCGEPFDRFKRH